MHTDQKKVHSGASREIERRFVDRLLLDGASRVFSYIDSFVPMPLRLLTFPIEYLIRRRIKKRLRRLFDKVRYHLELRHVGNKTYRHFRVPAENHGFDARKRLDVFNTLIDDKPNLALKHHFDEVGK